MPVYSMEVKLFATAYVRADTAAEALAIIQGNYGKGCILDLPTDDRSVSGARLDGADMPDCSLSPAVTFDGPADDYGEPELADS